MTWYYYLLAGTVFFLAAASAALFLPLRIFIFYLRENKEDRASLTVKIFRLGFKVKYFRNGESEVTSLLKLGRLEIRLPVFRRVGPGVDSVAVEMNRFEFGLPVPRGLFSPAGMNLGVKAFKALKPLLKKIIWKRFDLEVTYGLDDPSLAGLVYGGIWAAGGTAVGLLYHLFSFDRAPRLNFIPRFEKSGFRLCWEGEMVMPLFRGLKLLLITRKIGGAVSGTSSH